MPEGQPYVVCSRDEVLLIFELAREHQGHVRLSYREACDRLEIMLQADTPELTKYLRFMLDRSRKKTRPVQAARS